MTGVNILTYFREDHDFNDHHHHWHLVYPPSGCVRDGKHHRVIDRQGELFLYMHSQMIARYNAESLGWDLDMTHAWGYDDVLTFGYIPVPGLRKNYGARPPFQGWYENHSPHMAASEIEHFPPKKTLIEWRNNIFRAIESEHFVTRKSNGEAGKLKLTVENAFNWVGIVVEAESHELQEVAPGEFISRDLYGNLHNLGHNKFAEIGYSDKNGLGVMIDNQGSPRDPCFWLWHRHIDDFRQVLVKKYVHHLDEFKPDAKIKKLKIAPQDPASKTPAGGIATFLGPPQFEVDNADGTKTQLNEANAKLGHEPYLWELTVASTRNPPPDKSNPQQFTVRLFIAPAELIQDQRSWIEMDKFTHTLSRLDETIVRKDTDSSVARKVSKKLSSWCLCGWPQNMMLPIGKPGGMAYVAFAMLTDDKLGANKTQSLSFCGAQDHKYPDPRGMGYPFDKTWARRVESTASVRDIITSDDLPHTMLHDFTIYRYTKFYQGDTSKPSPSTTITWDNTIKHFFTDRDISCMKENGGFDLGSHESVKLHCGQIYKAVSSHSMPDGEEKWSDEQVAKFKEWADADCP